jgi:Tfp pilus assembly protein PilV
MLGLLGLQLRSMAMQKDSLDRRTAAALATFAVERISSNYAAFMQGAYGGGAPLLYQATSHGPPPPAVSDATAAADWSALTSRVSSQLPDGLAYVATPSSRSSVTVVIGWTDPRRPELEAGVDPVCALAVGAAVSTAKRCFAIVAHP